ncbi:non-ribosomal peptide synthase/polyketide synthase [Pseudomonas putida]|uniref:Non-ribosomal peptide synthetase n=1 Tax=Pseudomonas putida TaxID=303 RepID=A0AAD0PDW5_PSEPU|nr:non-ribosomal peptide synthase/polyketide synthase [Pseudomonas putida]AXA24576.1 non-ribosomal peptide synthetase [Pseudomonas putida]
METQAALRIAQRFITLPLEKRRLYLEKMLAEGVSPANLPIPQVQSAFETLPVSYAQERQWFLWQMDPGSTAYNLATVLRLRGHLDIDALQRSLDWLEQRHESLRTRFAEQDGRLSQRILPPAGLPLAHEQLVAGTPGDAALDACIKARVEALTQQVFDLFDGALVRAGLLKVGEHDHVLAIVQHHIIADGASIQIMIGELVRAYGAFSQGQAPVAAALPIQYADYAIWQRHWMEAGERERQLHYWREQLGGEQPLLALPGDRPRPAVQSLRGERLEVSLDADLSRQLRSLAQGQGATLFMLLLASFQLFLHRYSGQHDIRVGVPVANRNRPETEGLLGFFVNTQVLRAEIDGQQPFRAFLEQVKHTALRAQEHQDLPFEQLVEALQPQRSLSHAPLFQVMFNHQRSAPARGQAQAAPGSDLRVEGVAWDNPTAQFDLTLETHESDDALIAAFTYATDLFERDTVQRLVAHWQTLLAAIVAEPDQRCAELALMSAAETEQVRLRAQGPQVVHADARPVHLQVQAQAERTPQAVAVVCAGQQYSYAELDARANRLARELIARGVGPEVRVGIAAERSLELVVAMLAVLKAGAAYVPFDPAYPAERLAYMFDDSGIGLLLAQPALLTQLPLPQGLDVLALAPASAVQDGDFIAPQVAVDGEHLAYLIYTSGSTGQPKGVAVRHAGLGNHMAWMRECLPLTAEDRVLQKTAISFDASVWEFWLPLICGARLVLAAPGQDESLAQLWEQVQAHGITVLQSAPSLLQAMLPQARPEQLASLRTVLCGGEALSAQLCAQLRERWQGRLVNLYGPTEATIDSTACEVPAVLSGAVVPLGMPIDNASAYVLGEALQVCPAGAAGELCIGGEGLARGYHQRPAMTAERFVPDPFSSRPGARLYRSGDLVRQADDGVIDYLGRIDHQVKIRGLRIELGEIEARLVALPGVRQALVLAREQQLLAYVVPEPGQDEPLAVALREALQGQLPAYMVPNHLLLLDAFPLTSNGKLDRKALPLPEANAGSEQVAPANDLELRLHALWRDVLKCQALGVTDNFFELGGDSIVSIQLVSRARQAGIRFTPKQLFQHQTIRALAQVAELGGQELVIDQAPVHGSLPLLPAQQAFFAALPEEPARWNQSVWLKPARALSVETLTAALSQLVNHHDALRLSFGAQGAYFRTPEAMQALYQQSALLWQAEVEDDAALEALADRAQGSLALEDGSLLRAVLAQLADGSQRLLLVIHHLVVDGISWRILFDDLQQSLTQLDAGQPCVLPAKTSSLKAWAERLAAAAEGDMRGQMAYWQTALAGAPRDLPVNDPQGSLANALAHTVHTRLDAETTRRLLQEAPAAYRTQVNDLLLTALARVVAPWCGSDSALVQLEGHGREELFDDIDLTRTVGWFTSLFPVRLDHCADLGSAIKRVKEQLRAVPDKGLGFGVLRYLGSADDRAALQALPQPRITFNYLGQFDASFDPQQALLRPSGEARGREQGDAAQLGNWLTLNGQVYDGQLSLSWTFSPQMLEVATVQGLADAYREALGALVEHCTEAGHAGLTPSDVPLAELDQAGLDALQLDASTVEDIYPLSPMQHGMLFHSLYDQAGGDYINQMRADVQGLDVARFRAAWQATIEAHAILRTGLRWQGELTRPLQVVQRQVQVPFTEVRWDGQAPDSARLDALAREAREQGFDLEQAPLLRLLLVGNGANSHHLIFTSHHILMDGWSTAQLLGEVLQRYAGQAIAAPSGHYRDYIGWLQRQPAQAREAFWRQQLDGLQAPTWLSRALPAPQPGGQGGYADHHAGLDAQAMTRLGVLARQHKVTVNTLVQAAWLLLLQRYTGQRSVCFGATVAGRPAELKGIEQQIGLFINTLPVIAAPDPQETLAQWLQTVQGVNLALREHEHTPLFEIQRWAEQGSQGLFDTLLVFENYPIAEALEQGGDQSLRFSAVRAHEQSNYPLTLAVAAGRELTLHFNYDRTQLRDSAVEGVARHLLHLLEQFCADAQAPLHQLTLLEGRERTRIERQWNANGLDFDRSQCIHRLIEAQVRRTPQALAAIWGDEQLDYATLNARANRLARHLVSLGVGPEVRVGVALPRGMSMLVALLAVLKAGGAYVPLDPDYPAERVSYMLDDSAARLLISERSVLDALAVDGAFASVLLDELTLDGDDSDLPARAVADNLAYVIYTSGSTGRPKGVAIAHRNVAALVAWSQQVYSQADIQGVLASTSICFDLSVWELFVTLAGGGFIVGARNALELPELAARDQVRLINSVPSAASALLRAGQIPASVRIVNLAGEPLKQSVVEALYALEHIQHVYDLYGPSEDTTYSTWTRREAGGQANIGRPLHNTASYLLDGELQSVPVGATAELYLAGEGITRGYLLRPGLTAEKYLPDPFAADGSRLYRTGDLARYREDGVLEYAGRVDHQVKVRGLRIELGEIEARLQAQGLLRESAVLAVELNGVQQLVAYVVANDLGADESELRSVLKANLQQTLPDYMVPTHWLFLERLPLTPNGKLDRKALPAPQATAPARQVAPRSVLEKRLVAIWEEVLKVSPIGVTDNFFELGGDSIISIQVVSRARQAGIRFTPKALFQHQTVQGLATVAQEGEGAQLIEQGPLTGEMPLLPIQQAFFDTDIPERHHWNQSVLLKPAQPLHAGYLEQALQALVAHHDALRLSFTESETGWQAHYRPLNEQPTELLWQRTLNTADELEALAESAQRSLSLGDGPLLRAVLADLPDGSQRLLLVIHHLAVDGVSWRILFEDLQLAFEQLSSGRPLALPGKTSSQRDWVEQLRQHASTNALEQLEYWQAQGRELSAELPWDRADGGQRNRDGSTLYSRLDKQQTRRLLQDAPAAYRTQVNDLLLTALAQVVCAWTGQAHALVQLEGHGREDLFEHLDLTRSVGWFTSVFPLRLTPAAGLGDSLKQIKEQLRAVPDKGLGFGVLSQLAAPQVRERLAGLPTPSITFNYLGQFDASFASGEAAFWLPCDEARGAEQHPDAPLANALSVNGQVFDGELSLGWTFSDARFDNHTIQALADAYTQALLALIEHCCQPQAGGLTPSDVPLARLSQAQLDALPVAAASVQDLYPLSPMQQGMLFHSLYEQASGDYVNQMRVDIDGLEPMRFRDAWQATLLNHDILRTGFLWQGGLSQPLQVVARQVEVPFALHDWQGRADQAGALDALALAERAQGFDLEQAPLLRVQLIATAPGRHHLLLTHHHILMDGWSHSQLLGEVLARYAGEAVAAPVGRYRDYIAWLQAQDAEACEAFWRQQLAELDEPTHLARAIRQEPRAAGAAHGDYRIAVDEAVTARLANFAREQKVTLNTLVQAAWLLLLQRYTGQASVCFGATVAGRPAELPGMEQQMGLFINTLPVVATPTPQQTVADWLQAVQARNLALREFEHAPLYEIQRLAGQGGGALFDTLLVFENFPVSEVLEQAAPEALRFDAVSNHEQTSYPLTLAVNQGASLLLHYSYDGDSFEAATIERLAAHLGLLLEGLAVSATQALGEVSMLDAHERALPLEVWNATAVEYPLEHSVQALIQRQVEATPDATALVFGERQLSYRQLDALANQWAHRLQAAGVGPDVLVGVAAERSVEMVVALLAVIKAGGAYVPLDPEYPRERLAYMIEDSGIELLLTQSHLREQLPLPQGLECLLLDQPLSGHSEHAPVIEVTGENLAYVIYTSGSTGKPKGAGNRHRALTNRLCWMQQAYGLTAGDRVLQKTPFSFDVSVWEFFWPLMTGACLVVAAPGLHRDPAQLIELIRRERITTLHFVPSMLQAFVADPAVAGCASLTRIVCSGEALPVDAQRQVFDKLPNAGLYNLYGPTEAAIDVTHWTCREEGRDSVPIGEPIANLQTYVLDAGLGPVALGVVGELYLGGTGLARGYHRRPGLTAERFVASPFGDGERLYRTGDLARYRADGVIEYMGRIDHQVKIRGLRIELGEIEARLMEQDEVREAVVLAVPGAGGLQLAGYLVPSTPVADDAAAEALRATLRERLGAVLPDYMVPVHLLLLDQLPLSPNGKLERRALPSPELAQARYVAPRSEREQQLAQIWKDVLQVPQVGLDDDFFALGGHSLLATQVIVRIREHLGIEVPLKTLFNARHLGEFSASVQALDVGNDPLMDELAKSLEALERLTGDELEKLISE